MKYLGRAWRQLGHGNMAGLGLGHGAKSSPGVGIAVVVVEHSDS